MSAYIVPKDTIDVLVTAWSDRQGGVSPEACNAFGRMLWRENFASVAYRYPREKPGSLLGPVPNPDPNAYKWTHAPRAASTHAVNETIYDWRYQTCEHPGHLTSRAWIEVDKLIVL